MHLFMNKPKSKRGRPSLGKIRFVAHVRPETAHKIESRAHNENSTRGDIIDRAFIEK